MFKILNRYGEFQCKSFPEETFWESIINALSQNKLNTHLAKTEEHRRPDGELDHVDLYYNIILHKPVEFKTKIRDITKRACSVAMPDCVPPVLPALPFSSFMSDFFIVCINFDYIKKKVDSMYIEEVFPTNAEDIGNSSTWESFIEWSVDSSAIIIFKDR